MVEKPFDKFTIRQRHVLRRRAQKNAREALVDELSLLDHPPVDSKELEAVRNRLTREYGRQIDLS